MSFNFLKTENMYNCPCPVCHYGRVQEHKWYYMDDSVLMQTVLEGFEEVLRRSQHTRAPYAYPLLHTAGMMGTEAQHFHPSTSHTMVYPPTINAEESFMLKDMDALTGRMQNTYITEPIHSTEAWAADGGTAYGPSPSYDTFAPWPDEGYVSAPQAQGADEDIGDSGQQNLNETSFPCPAPSPIPTISVTEHLEQGTFSCKQPVKGKPAGVDFNAGFGVSLRSLDTLADGRGPAFDEDASIGEKASIRFELPQFPEHSMQVRVRHGKGRDGRPVTRREMAERVFDELKKLMDHAARNGDPLQHRGSVVDIGRVVLLRVDHISKGSIQPILGIRNNG